MRDFLRGTVVYQQAACCSGALRIWYIRIVRIISSCSLFRPVACQHSSKAAPAAAASQQAWTCDRVHRAGSIASSGLRIVSAVGTVECATLLPS
jgi:hypothetical protein